MLEQIYKSQSTIQQLRDGILGNYMDDFSACLIKKEYSQQTLRSYFGLISKLSTWLQDHRLKLNEFNELRINEFIEYRKKTTANIVRKGDGRALQLLVEFLRNEEIIPKPEICPPENKSVEALMQEFACYLTEEKGLADSTVNREKDVVRQFLLKQFGQQTLCFQNLTQSSLLAYISNSRKHYSSKNTQLIASILRTFLHFLVVNGKIKSEFTRYIPSIPSYRAIHLPEFLTQNQVHQLLASCDQNTPSGCRNYAILLLLVRLGLRASEVLKLSLDDIDWEQGNIHIYGKREKLRVLPLPHEVGKAIATYLKKVRPNCSIRQLFIRSRAPLQGLRNSSNISSIVHRALLSAGLSPRHQGAHLLRYTAATESLRCGATLFEIGDLLGHCSMDTTALYTKVDIVRLKELAMPWPTVI
ncbi:MAG: site-specific integrase [Pseudomonadota bacterium]|nr:site-specific integrase [Pseudomonadota bacterium]